MVDVCVKAGHLTFALPEVQLDDGLQQRVSVEGQVKLRANFGLQSALHPLVLGRVHTLDQRV